MTRRIAQIPWWSRVVSGGLLAGMLAFGSSQPEGAIPWPLGSVTLGLFVTCVGFIAFFKRDHLSTAGRPFRVGGRGRMVLHGMILPDGRTVRSPFTGRQGVAFVIHSFLHSGSTTWVATAFRVRQPSGNVVRVWLPYSVTMAADGPRMRVGRFFDIQEALAFWKSAFARTAEANETDAWIEARSMISYEQCYAPGDEITMAAYWKRIRPAPGAEPYDVPTFQPGGDLVVGLGSPDEIGRLVASELNYLRVVLLPIFIIFEMAAISSAAAG